MVIQFKHFYWVGEHLNFIILEDGQLKYIHIYDIDYTSRLFYSKNYPMKVKYYRELITKILDESNVYE